MNSQPSTKADNQRNGMLKYIPFMLAILSSTIIYFDKNLLQLAIIPIRSQFSLSAGQAGLLMSAYSLGYAIIGLPGGWLIDRFGYKRVIIVCMALATLTSFSFSLASTLLLFITIRFVMGAAHASIPSATTKIIATNYDEKQKMFLQSFSFLSSNLGSFIATSFGAYLIAINWKYSYWCVVILYIITILLIIKFLPTRTDFGKNIKSTESQTNKSISIKTVFSNSNVWILAIGVFCFNLFLNGYNMWLASFLSTTRHMSMGQIGGILSISNIVGLGSAPLAGILLSKLFKNKEKYFILLSAIAASVVAYFVVTATNPIVITIAIFINTYFALFPFVAVKTIPHVIINEKIIGSTMGAITTVSSLGGLVAPTLLGLIIDMTKGNFQFGYFVLIGIMIIGGLACLLLSFKTSISDKSRNQ